MTALDSNVFIYLLEGHPQFGESAKSIFMAVERGELDVCASELVFLEVLSLHLLSAHAVDQASTKLTSLSVSFASVSRPVLLDAARLRRQCGLGALDSVHVASALATNCSEFITNDQELLKHKVPGLKLVSLATD